jgi:hypothetical protein
MRLEWQNMTGFFCLVSSNTTARLLHRCLDEMVHLRWWLQKRVILQLALGHTLNHLVGKVGKCNFVSCWVERCQLSPASNLIALRLAGWAWLFHTFSLVTKLCTSYSLLAEPPHLWLWWVGQGRALCTPLKKNPNCGLQTGSWLFLLDIKKSLT